MGLFDNAPSFEDMKKQATATGSGTKLKYLHQGVHSMTYVGSELFKASNGNVALVMKYDSGFQTKNGEPNILYKHYYLMDKATLGLPFSEERQEIKYQRLIDPISFQAVATMLAQLFDLDIKEVSTMKEEWETFKLGGMARKIESTLLARPEKQRQIAGTVEFERSPNREGKYFLALEWCNPIGQLEERKKAFKPKDNPNPPAPAATTTSTSAPSGPVDPHWEEEPPF